jgi:hypothetical protein
MKLSCDRHEKGRWQRRCYKIIFLEELNSGPPAIFLYIKLKSLSINKSFTCGLTNSDKQNDVAP